MLRVKFRKCLGVCHWNVEYVSKILLMYGEIRMMVRKWYKAVLRTGSVAIRVALLTSVILIGSPAMAVNHDKPWGEPYVLEGKRLVFTNWEWITPGQFDWLDANGKSGFANTRVKAGPEDAHFAEYDIPFGVHLRAEQAKVIGPIVSRDQPWEKMGLSICSIIRD